MAVKVFQNSLVSCITCAPGHGAREGERGWAEERPGRVATRKGDGRVGEPSGSGGASGAALAGRAERLWRGEPGESGEPGEIWRGDI